MIDPMEAFLHERVTDGLGGRWYGVHVATVVDIKDPNGQGAVKVRLPWSPDSKNAPCEVWARLCAFMAGPNRGGWFVPDPDDEVLVAFQAGDPSRPFVLGMLWNGSDHPPQSMDGAGRNEKKVLRSRNGVKITLDDATGKENLILETPGGQKLAMHDGPGGIEIQDSNGNSIKLQTTGITVDSSSKVTINASQVAVSAGMVTVDAGMSKFSGVVQADTVITNTIIAATYTPGAGNIW